MLEISICQDEGAPIFQGGNHETGYLEQLKSDMAARFETDLRKPKAKTAVKPTAEEDTCVGTAET